MNIAVIAQRLIDELTLNSVELRLRAEGVALLFNKLVEAADAEKAQEEVAEEK